MTFRRVFGCAGILLLSASAAPGQWEKPRDPSVPRTVDGRPNLTAPAPRTADGKPDLSGMWLSNLKYNGNLAADLKAQDVPMTPWGKALYDERTKTFSRDDPENYCLPDGVPQTIILGIVAAEGFGALVIESLTPRSHGDVLRLEVGSEVSVVFEVREPHPGQVGLPI